MVTPFLWYIVGKVIKREEFWRKPEVFPTFRFRDIWVWSSDFQNFKLKYLGNEWSERPPIWANISHFLFPFWQCIKSGGLPFENFELGSAPRQGGAPQKFLVWQKVALIDLGTFPKFHNSRCKPSKVSRGGPDFWDTLYASTHFHFQDVCEKYLYIIWNLFLLTIGMKLLSSVFRKI